jgi:hypothetical protein
MTTTRTLPHPPADEAEAHERILAYAAERRHATLSTERADRPAAEAAIRRLCRARGEKEPRIIWVPSPLAGVLAYGGVSEASMWVRDPNARGDIGNGANQVENSLRDPFSIEGPLQHRLWQRIQDRLPSDMPRVEPRSRWDTISTARATVELGSTMGLRTGAAIEATLRGALRRRVAQSRPNVPVDSTTDDALLAQLTERLLGPTWTSCAKLVGPEAVSLIAKATVRHALSEAVDAWMATGVRMAMLAMQPGQFDVETPFFASVSNVFGAPIWRHRAGRRRYQALMADRLAVATSAGPWWALKDLAIVSERPLRLEVDTSGRLHSETGPALAYADGFAIHAWHGIQVEPWIILEPERIGPDIIEQETNAEMRRVLVERFGVERLIRESGSELLDEDDVGRLWRRDFGAGLWPREEPIVMVEVLNSTPEPDGTRRTYFLRVPPEIETAREAVAWTFGMDGAGYAPAVES